MKNGENQLNGINWNLMFAVCLLFVLFIFDPASLIVSSYVMFAITIFKVLFVTLCSVYMFFNVILRQINANAFKNVSSDIQLKMNLIKTESKGQK